MNSISDKVGVAIGRRRRRIHSDEFKAQVVAACKPAGVSIAAVATANDIGTNLARRSVVAAEGRSGNQSTALASAIAPAASAPRIVSTTGTLSFASTPGAGRTWEEGETADQQRAAALGDAWVRELEAAATAHWAQLMGGV